MASHNGAVLVAGSSKIWYNFLITVVQDPQLVCAALEIKYEIVLQKLRNLLFCDVKFSEDW